MYELYIEGYKVDIDQKISVQLSFSIDDVANFSSRETGFSKTIVLPGTGRNNQIFGYIYDLGSFNYEQPGGANIGAFFNVAQTSRAELRLNGLLVLKGVFRITNIIKDKDIIEYEGAIFGELAGFVAEIGTNKLEDLDFSEYNHNYTRNNIVNSWNGIIEFSALAAFTNNLIGSGSIISILDVPGTLPVFAVGTNFTVSESAANNKVYTITAYNYNSVTKLHTYNVSESVTVDATFKEVKFTGLRQTVATQYGKGYYYPLIDHGTYSTPQTNPTRAKIDYDYRTFRPALFVKEYIDKMFSNPNSNYTYESQFMETDFFKRLIIPCNFSKLTKLTTDLIEAKKTSNQTLVNLTIAPAVVNLKFESQTLLDNFTVSNNEVFTYTGAPTQITVNIVIKGQVVFTGYSAAFISFGLRAGAGSPPPRTLLQAYSRTVNGGFAIIDINKTITVNLNTNDTLYVDIQNVSTDNGTFVNFSTISVKSTNPVIADLQLGNAININNLIPRNITQKDFFTWILKMFNLYVTEDKIKDKHLIIEPYVDYYGTDTIDWTYKVDRSKPWQIKPMGQLNSRFFEYKFKEDNDFYNESYRKKYNQSYGNRLHDTDFQFAKDKQTVEVGFSPTILIQYDGTNQSTKILPVIYKKSKGNSVDQEELTESNIRILQAKKITTGVASWYIRDNSSNSNLGAALTSYGYAGHFDDPINPTKDINFGAASEIYFDPNTYPTNNLFNDYWSEYIAEIADKDSKILSCYVHLTPLDIAQLDFSKAILIDGVRFRLNKVEDFDYTNNELVKVELLKIINNG